MIGQKDVEVLGKTIHAFSPQPCSHRTVQKKQGFALAGLQNTDGVVSGEYRPFLWCTHAVLSFVSLLVSGFRLVLQEHR